MYIQYQMLHVSPPHRPTPAIAKNTELSDATGFLNLHKGTLQHVKYSNIFGIGDCTSLPTSKTAAAVGMETGNSFNILIIIGLEELRETTKTCYYSGPWAEIWVWDLWKKEKSMLPNLSAMCSLKVQQSNKMWILNSYYISSMFLAIVIIELLHCFATSTSVFIFIIMITVIYHPHCHYHYCHLRVLDDNIRELLCIL